MRIYNNQMLHLLVGISNANTVLLQESNVNESLQKVVEELGKATDVDRCYIFTNKIDTDGILKLYYTHEWCNKDIEIQLGNPDLSGLEYAIFPGLYETLINQEAYYGIVKESQNELFKEVMESQDIKAFLFTPIFCEGVFWGWMGYDDCQIERKWLSEEVEALHVVAKNIGIRLSREKSEQRVLHSQERFNLSVLGSQQGIWEFDVAENKWYFSQIYMSMAGYASQEFEQTFEFAVNIIHPDDKSNVVKAFDDYIHKRIPEFSVEFRQVHKEGHCVWVRGSAVGKWDDEGKLIYLAGSHLDITRLKTQQQELEQQRNEFDYLINNLAEVVFRLNTANEFTFLNDYWYNLTGYTQQESTHKTICSFMADDDVEFMKKQFSLLEGKANHAINIDVKLKHKDGNYRWVNVIASKFKSSFSDTSAFAGSIIDINDRKEAQEREKELTELKSNFVSMASHQFRTPLTVIYSNIELIESYASKLDDKSLERFTIFASRIKGEIDRMTELMNNILLFGRYNAQELSVNLKPVELSALIDRVLETYFSNQPDGRKIIFDNKDVRKIVALDELLFIYILTNIISNAFKYSVGKPNPELEIVYKENEIDILVKDYGIGVPPDEKSKLFSSFYRASNTSTIQGSGLGLVIAKQFTELHQGTIKIDSELDKGTLVTLTLPNAYE